MVSRVGKESEQKFFLFYMHKSTTEEQKAQGMDADLSWELWVTSLSSALINLSMKASSHQVPEGNTEIIPK